jgi:hypothetical protein
MNIALFLTELSLFKGFVEEDKRGIKIPLCRREFTAPIVETVYWTEFSGIVVVVLGWTLL